MIEETMTVGIKRHVSFIDKKEKKQPHLCPFNSFYLEFIFQ